MNDQKARKREKSSEAHQSEGLGPAKIIRDRSGKKIKQYPADIGRHGTDNEKKLNPEE